MLPVVAIQVPTTERGIKILLHPRGAVEIQIRFNSRDQIVMRPVIRVEPDGFFLTLGQLVHPIVFLEIPLHHEEVLGLAHGREIHPCAGDNPLGPLPCPP